MRMAKAGRPGPVHLSLPSDLLEGERTRSCREGGFLPKRWPGMRDEILEALQRRRSRC
jgi:thiamine pyrophosphate-dependent acetolactate synthase large subunit-like protein